MTPRSSLTAGKTLLGAALAGLSLVSTDAEAAVYTESTDFGNSFETATDLSSTFGNFLEDNQILAVLQLNNSDQSDFVAVSVAPSTAAVINLSASRTAGADSYFGLQVLSGSGAYLAGYNFALTDLDTTYEDQLSFMTPADGILVFNTQHESAGGTFNYSIGSVPEPASALLGAAGLAAAALRRRRED